jgi:hypothetical protein
MPSSPSGRPSHIAAAAALAAAAAAAGDGANGAVVDVPLAAAAAPPPLPGCLRSGEDSPETVTSTSVAILQLSPADGAEVTAVTAGAGAGATFAPLPLVTREAPRATPSAYSIASSSTTDIACSTHQLPVSEPKECQDTCLNWKYVSMDC